MPSIVTLTMNPALDIATTTERVVPTEKLRCGKPRYDPGGGGINVARGVHMLGGDVLAVFPVGGMSGEMLCRLLDGEHVPHAVVPIAGITRESLAVVERQSGKQYRFLLPGPTIGVHDQERCLDTLAAHVAGVSYLSRAAASHPASRRIFTRAPPGWRETTICASSSIPRAGACSRRQRHLSAQDKPARARAKPD